jgi:hypothetical protein
MTAQSDRLREDAVRCAAQYAAPAVTIVSHGPDMMVHRDE